MRPEHELGARSPHLKAFSFDRDGEVDRRCRLVRDVDMNAETALTWVEMRREKLHAGPFHEAHREARGEHLRHDSELGRLFIEIGHRLAHRYRVDKTMGKVGLSVGFMAWRPWRGEAPRLPSRRRGWRYSCLPKGSGNRSCGTPAATSPARRPLA